MHARALWTAAVAAMFATEGAAAESGPRPGEDFEIPQLGVAMTWLAPGSFRMGSPPSEPGHEPDERPVAVRFTEGFWIGRTEVTVGQWRRFADATGYAGPGAGEGIHERTADGWKANPRLSWRDPGFPQDDAHPVVGVSWEDAVAFCAWLTRSEREAGRLPDGWVYGLPTEAQWEYACRAGTTGPFATGDALTTNQARFGARDARDDGGGGTRPAGSFAPNAWGLVDLHGNAWEWCADAHADYPTGELVDPRPAAGGERKVRRGGSWIGAGENCRSANRNRDQPGHRAYHLGFRVALRRPGAGAG